MKLGWTFLNRVLLLNSRNGMANGRGVQNEEKRMIGWMKRETRDAAIIRRKLKAVTVQSINYSGAIV